MSERLPSLKAIELVRILEKIGFSLIRQKGSHAFFHHPDGRNTSVPIHSGDLSRYVLREILKQIEVSEEDLMKLL
ncbi:MAG: type II toxin-antitoxin system HicA family toxin [bacterium]